MNELEKWKNDYTMVNPPEELKERVGKAMEQAKKDKKKKALYTLAKGTGIVAAAAVLSITILTNTNSTLAMAMEKIPVIGSISKVVTFRAYHDVHKKSEANLKVPQVLVDAEAEKENTAKKGTEELNKEMESYIEAIMEQYKKDAKASDGAYYYSVDTDYEVVTNTDATLVIKIQTTETSGSSYNYAKYYYFDKKKGRILTLKDMFYENADYVSVISDYIKNEMRRQMKEDETIAYFLDDEIAESNFQQIKPDQNFYFDPNGSLVLSFDEYEVAPGYMGMVTFTIPKDVFQNLLK